ncbi:TIGR00282 family metallophosphoesterase [Haloplasma contractile]|uniref:Metallophosphoesterase family protein n=1 Tax=Haloplasma contractile SSD-17B TaxID=1033810 RepID=U2FRL0_9MOLU|nr:TIGR00282 family metallophosphoesterase [Haloplasma contractile]ERJ13599.1 Metallophosphoesterase family protein [Haloplasma contractile SSD-17B]
MNILFIGDAYGSLGRKAVEDYLPTLRSDYGINFVILNGENAAHGRGITEKIYRAFLEQGIQVITLGNHAWDNRDIFNFIDQAKCMVRPANYPIDRSGNSVVPGKGYEIFNYNQYKIAVINLMGQTFMNPLENPFHKFDEIYEEIKDITPNIFVDFHAEASSEKIAFGYYVAGRATGVLGTHTHVPTADDRILDNHTGYITDVGMTGPVDGVIGVTKEPVIKRFLSGLPTRFNPVEEGPKQLNAVVLSIDPETGRTKTLKRININEAKGSLFR